MTHETEPGRHLIQKTVDEYHMKLPRGDQAMIDSRKITDYCLSSEHDDEKHKARLFMDRAEARDLTPLGDLLYTTGLGGLA